MFLLRRSHLQSCRCIFPGPELWDQSQVCQCCPLATVKAKSFASSLSVECQSWSQEATQISLTLCHLTACFGRSWYRVPGEIVLSQLCKHGCLALSCCCFWMCSVYASLGLSPPCHTCHSSICGHLPPLALLLLILGSPPNPWDTVWWRACPAMSLPWELGQLSSPIQGQHGCSASPALSQGMAPMPSPCGHFAGAQFLWGLRPSEGQFGKGKVVGASRAVSSFPGTCRGLRLFCGPLTEGHSLSSVHFSRNVHLRVEQLKPWWNGMLGFRLFWAGNRRLLAASGWPYNLWVLRNHSLGAICKL